MQIFMSGTSSMTNNDVDGDGSVFLINAPNTFKLMMSDNTYIT